MSDCLTPYQRHTCMSHVHGKNTSIEIVVRHRLFCRGFRYRLNVKSLPGSPDIVLPKYRTVIFVNGCFWHGHRNCRYATTPKTNTEYWVSKIERNRARDDEKFRQLEALQWNVIIVWECELKKDKVDETIEKLAGVIKENGEIWKKYKEDRRANMEEYSMRCQMARERRQRFSIISN